MKRILPDFRIALILLSGYAAPFVQTAKPHFSSLRIKNPARVLQQSPDQIKERADTI